MSDSAPVTTTQHVDKNPTRTLQYGQDWRGVQFMFTQSVLGCQLPHAVRVEQLVEGDPQQLLSAVAQVSLSAETTQVYYPDLFLAPFYHFSILSSFIQNATCKNVSQHEENISQEAWCENFN